MELHSPTILMAILAVNATLTVALAAGASRTARDGVLLWAVAFTLHTLAYVLFGLRDAIPDLASMLVAAVLLATEWALLAEGLFQFQKRPPPRKLIWAPVAAILIVFAISLEHPEVRIVVSGLVYSTQVGLVLWILHRGRRETVGRGQYFVALGVAPIIPIFIFRAFLAATGHAEKVMVLASNRTQTVSYLASIAATILVGVGLLLMNKEKSEDRNRRSATEDQLTGLANRRRIDEVLASEWARARRNHNPLALVLVDVDLFKKYNDCYGHQEGDECLKRVADVLQGGAQRAGDLAARYGGEEFLLILPNTDAAVAQRLTESLREKIAALGVPHEQSPLGKVTISAGIAATGHGTYENAESLLRAADVALYQAKQDGRNQVRLAQAPQIDTEDNLAGFVQLVWHSAYESGNPVIDNQHRMLFDDINRLLAASLAGKSTDQTAALIDTLLVNTAQHFKDEEAILAASGYQGTANHAALHRQLIDRAVELVGRFREGNLGIGELFQFLAHELVARHLLGADRKFFMAVAASR